MGNRKKTGLVGQELGNYHIEEQISFRDGSGVYRAQEIDQGTPVFLAVVETDADQAPDLAGRFQRRMETVAQLNHPYIAAVEEIGQTQEGLPYAAMAFGEGRTLADRLQEIEESGEKLPVIEALELVGRIAEALRVAHPAGIIHQDLRPENLLLDEADAPLFFDLGIPIDSAASISASEMLRTEELDYASPEQFEGKALSGQSNIYTLGIILYELLAGHRPHVPTSSWDIFDSKRTELPRPIPLREAQPGLAPETYDLVKNCLWREEWNRFETVDAMLGAIERAKEAEHALALKAGTRPSYRKWFLVALPVILLLVLLIFLLTRNPDGGTNGPEESELTPAGLSTTSFEGLAGGTETVTPTSMPTPSATPSPRATTGSLLLETIELLAPPSGSQFEEGEEFSFNWQWSDPLEPEQQFSVYIFVENESRLLGTVTQSEPDGQYELDVHEDGDLAPGSYFWQVVLELSSSGRSLASSEFFAIIIISPESATATSRSTATPTIAGGTAQVSGTVTATPTASGGCQVDPPADWEEYTIQSGDTVFVLASRTGTTPAELRQINCLEGNLLTVGETLWLPFAPPTSTPAPAATPTGSGSGPPSPPTPRPTLTPPPPP